MFVSALPLLIKIVVSFTTFVSFNAFSLGNNGNARKN